MVQLGVVRLLGVRAIVGPEAMPAAQAWFRLEELVEDERVEMLIEPPGLYEVLPSLFRYRQPTPNLINDAYLAAFAIAGGYGLVTHDRGFAEFRGLDVEILSV
jgi:predicted nucleic acid-binding protein